MIIEMTAEKMSEIETRLEQRKLKPTKSVTPPSKVTYRIRTLLEQFNKIISPEKRVEKELNNIFDENGRLYFSELTEEKFKNILEYQAEKTAKRTLEKLTEVIQELLELSEIQDKTAIYNARKLK